MTKAATAVARTYPTSVGVPENNRQAIIALLNARLADSSDLRTQVKWAHSNVKGLHFIQLHELFDSIASPTLSRNVSRRWVVSPMERLAKSAPSLALRKPT